jgi:hypothetical protein
MNSTFLLFLMIGFYEKKREVLTEAICPVCDGTGLQKVKQPTEPGRKSILRNARNASPKAE